MSNGRSYRYINQFVSSRYCFDFGTDASGTPCMNPNFDLMKEDFSFDIKPLE